MNSIGRLPSWFLAFALVRNSDRRESTPFAKQISSGVADEHALLVFQSRLLERAGCSARSRRRIPSAHFQDPPASCAPHLLASAHRRRSASSVRAAVASS